MKKLIIALTAIVTMASCKKENVTTAAAPDPTPIPGVTKTLVKTSYVYDNGAPDAQYYTYDAEGRIATIKDDTRTTTFNFISAASLVATERKNSDNSIISTKECTINEKGFVTKIINKSPGGALILTYDYTYTADGYVSATKITFASGSTTEDVYTIADGNVVASKRYYDNVLSSNSEYSYDNTKVNKTRMSLQSYWNVPGLFGKSSKNMWIEYKTINTSSTIIWHSQSTYEFDADGYPTKQTVNYVLQGKQGVDTFTYQ
jgi:hypothetical protein